jgi:hypothetical protein
MLRYYKLSKILILEDKPVQVRPTTYERRQQIEGVGFYIWNGSEENYAADNKNQT